MDKDITPFINFITSHNKILHQICFELYDLDIDSEFSILKPEAACYAQYVKNICISLKGVDINKERKSVESKLSSTKKRWFKQVLNYYQNGISSKYILLEKQKLESVLKLADTLLGDSNKLEAELQFIFDKRVSTLEAWVEDGMLHQFEYLDDLQTNQRKLILEVDTSFLILKELQQSQYLLNCFENTTNEPKSIPSIDKNKNCGGQMPGVLVSVDGIFRASKPLPHQIEMFEDEILFRQENTDVKYSLSVPTYFKNDEGSVEIDYTNERTYLTAYEQRILVAILQLGRRQIQASNKIRFSKNQLLDILDLSKGGKNYNLVEKNMYNLFNFRHQVIYKNLQGESRVLSFVIFQSIDRPKDNDLNDQGEREWTVTLNSDLHNQILERNFVDVFAEELRQLQNDVAAILLPQFAHDRLKSYKRINLRGEEVYSGMRLIEKCGLANNKPSKLLLRIQEAIDELRLKKICVQDYTINGTGKNTEFHIKFLDN